MTETTQVNEAADGQSQLTEVLGTVICEKWAVLYKGGRYTTGYVRGSEILLNDTEREALSMVNAWDKGDGSYTPVKVLVVVPNG
ncbi:MAG: hypothetical protein Q8K57_13235 [Thiobacillus sp.]|nr:hypothetical protein [Thiobacillus sp.]